MDWIGVGTRPLFWGLKVLILASDSSGCSGDQETKKDLGVSQVEPLLASVLPHFQGDQGRKPRAWGRSGGQAFRPNPNN